MKVLIDEDLDHRLCKNLLPLTRHEIFTVQYLAWAGLKNGELLKTAEENGIQVFVTGDQNLSYQQNFGERRLALLLFRPQTGRSSNHLPQISAAIDNALPSSFQFVECGRFR